MDNLMLSREELFNEATEIARAQGALSKEAWDDVVETVLDDKREFLEIDDDADIGQLTEALKARFEEFRGAVESM